MLDRPHTGLEHYRPGCDAFDMVPPRAKPKKAVSAKPKKKNHGTKPTAAHQAITLMETDEERKVRQKAAREAKILRVNAYSDHGRSTTNSDKTRVIVGKPNSARSQ